MDACLRDTCVRYLRIFAEGECHKDAVLLLLHQRATCNAMGESCTWTETHWGNRPQATLPWLTLSRPVDLLDESKPPRERHKDFAASLTSAIVGLLKDLKKSFLFGPHGLTALFEGRKSLAGLDASEGPESYAGLPLVGSRRPQFWIWKDLSKLDSLASGWGFDTLLVGKSFANEIGCHPAYCPPSVCPELAVRREEDLPDNVGFAFCRKDIRVPFLTSQMVVYNEEEARVEMHYQHAFTDPGWMAKIVLESPE